MKIKSTFTAPLVIIAVMLLTALSRRLELSRLMYTESLSLAVIVLELLILIVPTAFYIRLRSDFFAGRLRLTLPGPEKLLASLLAALTILLGMALLKLLFFSLGFIDGDFSVWSSFLAGEETNFLYRLVAFCLVPAVAEELLFRGVLCADYEGSGALTAVLASSLLYGMFTLNFGYLPIYLFAGLGYALVLFMTRSTLAAMLCHLVVNTVDMIVGETVWNIIKKPQSTVFLIFALAGLFLVCLFSLCSECERIYNGYAQRNVSSDMIGEQSALSLLGVLAAPPFIAAMLIFVAATLSGYR